MPADLTWWEAARYAKAGIPVRRESVTDPLAWFVREVPGLFHRYEQENDTLMTPAAADETHRVVAAAQFVAADFLATDWTTFGITPGTDVTPPSGGFPPNGGVPPDYPPGDPPKWPPIAEPPPFNRPPQPSLPSWGSLSATIGSGDTFACAGTLSGMPEGSSWACFADIPLSPAVSLAIGGGSGPAAVSCSGSAVLPGAAGLPCTFRALCVQGLGNLRGRVVAAVRIIAVA